MNRVAPIVLLLLLAGCSPIANVPSVVLGPAPDGASEVLLARVLQASVDHGWTATLIQANRGRFALRARHADELGSYVLAVEIYRDGRVSITPHGPRVERSLSHQYYLMPTQLRDEYNELAEVIGRAVRGPG